ncbi:MAG: hypothetical protein U9N59_13260 [Campylobacterota bacterium]|nr:hypothetical protein [Campylobacterota bacterium]
MTSVLYEDIKLCDASVKSIEKCEEFSKSKQRIELDKKRKTVMSRVLNARTQRGYQSAYR